MPTKMRRVVLGSISAALASRVHLAATTKIGRLPTRHGARRTGLLIRSRIKGDAAQETGVAGRGNTQVWSLRTFRADYRNSVLPGGLGLVMPRARPEALKPAKPGPLRPGQAKPDSRLRGA
ncbi:hypothetical protein B0H12DRAFT_1221655 [Mycena haematopus]|nr:hypothetical protein B0H12DRAFT_1221655 [Mycena haematopus]